MLTIGCFTIPASRQFQANGNRRPESMIGESNGNKIVIGKTRIENALLAIREKTEGAYYMHDGFGPPYTLPGGREWQWMFSPDGRRVGVQYQIRTGTEVWPLCFTADPVPADREIVLDIDTGGIVTGYSSMDSRYGSNDPRLVHCTADGVPDVYRSAFNADVRARLEAAGLVDVDRGIRDGTRVPTTTTSPSGSVP